MVCSVYDRNRDCVFSSNDEELQNSGVFPGTLPGHMDALDLAHRWPRFQLHPRPCLWGLSLCGLWVLEIILWRSHIFLIGLFRWQLSKKGKGLCPYFCIVFIHWRLYSSRRVCLIHTCMSSAWHWDSHELSKQNNSRDCSRGQRLYSAGTC